jgi:hypothetical protein
VSWSVSYSGDSVKAVESIEAQFASMTYPCQEPEESIKQAARAILKLALEGNVPSRGVSVSAWGSQSKWSAGDDAPDNISNTLNIVIG